MAPKRPVATPVKVVKKSNARAAPALSRIASTGTDEESDEEEGHGTDEPYVHGGIVATLARILPIALINATDYGSDLLVVRQFYLSGDMMSFYLGASMISLSIVVIWVAAFLFCLGLRHGQWGKDVGGTVTNFRPLDIPPDVKQKAFRLYVVVSCTAPFNLHVLAAGMCFVNFSSRLALRELPAIYSIVKRNKLRRDESVYNEQLMKNMELSFTAYVTFSLAKVAEGGLESLTMSYLAVATIVRGVGDDHLGLYVSSLVLSVLSMVYGTWSLSTAQDGFQIDSDRSSHSDASKKAEGRSTQLFFALLVHVCYAIEAVGSFLGADAISMQARLGTLLALMLFSYVYFVIYFWGIIYALDLLNLKKSMGPILNPVGWKRTIQSCLLLPLLHMAFLPAAPIFAAFDPCIAFGSVVDRNIWVDAGKDYGHISQWSNVLSLRIAPIARRLFLLGMAVASLYPEPSAGVNLRHALLMGALQILDLFASPRMFLLHGRLADDPIHWLWSTIRRSLMPFSPQWYCDPPKKDIDARLTRRRVLEPKAQFVFDILESIALMPEEVRNAVVKVDSGDQNISAEQLEEDGDVQAWRHLQEMCKGMCGGFFQSVRSGLHGDTIDQLKAALTSGRPRPKTAGKLIEDLKRIQNQAFHPLLSAGGQQRVNGVNVKQVKVLGLSAAHDPAAWARDAGWSKLARPSKDGECDYLVSHSSNENDDAVSCMRQLLLEFLCLHDLLGSAVVSLLLLALFLVPFGFAVSTAVPAFPVWLPSLFPVLILAFIIAWTVLSAMGKSSRFAPWSFLKATVCLQTCSAPEPLNGRGDPVYEALYDYKASIKRLKESVQCTRGQMIAFFSKEYLGDLRCVVVLALFCRRHQNQLGRRLIVLSHTWPRSWDPAKKTHLTDTELAWFNAKRINEDGRELIMSEYRCRDQSWCSDPRARAFLLQEIRRKWGPEDGEAKFNAFVRKEVLGAFKDGKERYQSQLLTVAMRSFELLFGD